MLYITYKHLPKGITSALIMGEQRERESDASSEEKEREKEIQLFICEP